MSIYSQRVIEENIFDPESLENIINLINSSNKKVLFPMGYATQRELRKSGLKLNNNVMMIDPIDYLEFCSFASK